MVEKRKIEDLSVLELKGVIFDLQTQIQQVAQILDRKIKEEGLKEPIDLIVDSKKELKEKKIDLKKEK
jgi:hypothetical protein